MLHDLVAQNRPGILAGMRADPASLVPWTAVRELGLRQFLEQLADALRDGITPGRITTTAASHGALLHHTGCAVTDVVHDFGDLSRAIMELAIAEQCPVELSEVHVLNACVDEAIASAVAEYSRQSERALQREGVFRLGALSHELRNKVGGVMLAYSVLRDGRLALGGATGSSLDRGLKGLEAFADRSMAEVRVAAGIIRTERVSVRSVLDEIELDAALVARELDLGFTVDRIEPGIEMSVDRAVLGGALMNLLSNAFKFTHVRSHVWVKVAATKTRVIFTVEDQCGGLTVANPEVLFRPWVQLGDDKQGLGLGLPLVRRSALALGGDVRVKNMPGQGCAFSLRVNRALD